MALKAADQVVGPDVLKVRTFSSRMDVESRRKKPAPNELAKIVSSAFFFPLTGRWWMQVRAFGTHDIYLSPFLLSSFIKTLAIILHASGGSVTTLPQMTSEFWDLLLSIVSRHSSDSTVMEALLFAFMTLLDINENKERLAREQSRELLETQKWVETVFGNVAGGDEEGDRLKIMAASILVRIKEIVQKYQRLLLGEMV
ncbi:MAG: telomere binding protein [Phylliscum demangeonii]|nr:MAG: telomere binding protein [Phylliscum demangeonii]